MRNLRLRRTIDSLIRRIQMSRRRFWFLHEGDLDVNFYERLMNAIPIAENDRQFMHAREIGPDETGGKKRLVSSGSISKEV